MSESHALDFLSQYSEDFFPLEITDRYIPLELLAQNDGGQTFLLEEKENGGWIVAKKYDNKSASFENDLSTQLSYEGLPVFVETIKTETHTFILRKYVPGITLEEYAQKRLSENEAVEIARKICCILEHLHNRTKPVIHRDIKPSNIIIEPETGKITLIDFGIARTYNCSAKKDTVFMGTRSFSPPEQYGFAQTDGRTDIYALGVLLCWLLTGQTDTKNAMRSIHSPTLRKIIRRCTAFDPNRRYQNARRLKRDLIHYNNNAKNKIAVATISVLIAACFFTAGYAMGRYNQADIPVLDNLFDKPVVFADPVLEGRVRTGINSPDGTISAALAAATTKLDLSAASPDTPDGNKIKDISALVYFKNLKSLDLSWNQVNDIHPLAGLNTLESLYLNGNGSIRDFTLLEGLVNMKDIMLVGCRVNSHDLQSCAKMGKLESFWVESMYLKDAGVVSNFPNLRKLVLKGCDISNISPVSSLAFLQEINLEGNPVTDFAPLLSLRNLKTVTLSNSIREQADQQLSGAQFEIKYQ